MQTQMTINAQTNQDLQDIKYSLNELTVAKDLLLTDLTSTNLTSSITSDLTIEDNTRG